MDSQSSRELGTIANVDHVHAVLPWAGSNLLLTIREVSDIRRSTATQEMHQRLPFEPCGEALMKLSPFLRLYVLRNRRFERLVLNGLKQKNAALDAVEDINRLLAEYAAIEDVYSTRDSATLETEFQEALIELCVIVLRIQATAACHCARKTILRVVRVTLQLDDWTSLVKISKARMRVVND